MDMKIEEYETEDLSVDHPQFFQGYGLEPEDEFDEAFTGVGDSAYSAVEDALDQAALSGYDVTNIEDEILTDFSDRKDIDTSGDEVHYVGLKLRAIASKTSVEIGDPSEFDLEQFTQGEEGVCVGCHAEVEPGEVMCSRCQAQVEKNRRILGASDVGSLRKDLKDGYYNALALSEHLEGDAKESASILAIRLDEEARALAAAEADGSLDDRMLQRATKKKDEFLSKLLEIPSPELAGRPHPVDDNSEMLTQDLTADAGGYDRYYEGAGVSCDRCGGETQDQICEDCKTVLDEMFPPVKDAAFDYYACGDCGEVEACDDTFSKALEDPTRHEEFDREYDLEPYLSEDEYLDMEMGKGQLASGVVAAGTHTIIKEFKQQVMDNLDVAEEVELSMVPAIDLHDVGEAVGDMLVPSYGVEQMRKAMSELSREDSDLSLAADGALAHLDSLEWR